MFVIIFMATFASSMVTASPVFFLVKDLAKTEEATAVIFAAVLSAGSLATIAANFAGGFLADRVGRRNVIALGSAMLAPTLLAYTIVPSAFWIIAVYFMQVFATSMFQPAFMAFVADMSKVSSRGKAFGNFNLFWIGGTVPAPLIGGFLADAVGLHFPFAIASLVSIISLVASFGLVESSPQRATSEDLQTEGTVEKALMPFATVMLLFGVMSLLTGVLNGMISPLIRFYCVYKLKVSPTELGLVYSLGSGLITTLVQIPGGRLTDKSGRKPLMLIGFLGAPFIIAMAYTSSVSQFTLASAGLMAFGNLSAPAYYAWMMDLVPSAKRARTSGLMNSITGIGMFMGAPLSTWIFEAQPSIVLPFVATSVPFILQIPLVLKLKETKAT